MQRLVLNITNQNVKKEGDEYVYSLRANGIKFEQRLKENQRSPENMEALNNTMKQSLRYVKHLGGYPDKEHEDHKAMAKELDKLSSTNTGIAIKAKNDPLPEYKPF